MKDKNPVHIAVIPDGNRRWARAHNFSPWKGHFKGADVTEEIIRAAFNMNIPYFTFWGASLNNVLKRPKIEVKYLYKIFTERFKKLSQEEEIHKKKVKVNVFGRWDEIFPKETKDAIYECINATKNYNKYFLTFLLAYNGTDEMVCAVRKIVKSNIKEITEKTIMKNLWTKDLPFVDLVIRTGVEGDPHWSVGFMMWHTANSQFYFSKILWPNFKKSDFARIIENYKRRQRRLGK